MPPALLAQTPTPVPTTLLDYGAVGAVIFVLVIFLYAGKWVVEKLSGTFEKVGSKIETAIDKQTEKMNTHQLEITADRTKVAAAVEAVRLDSEKRHVEDMAAHKETRHMIANVGQVVSNLAAIQKLAPAVPIVPQIPPTP